MFGHHFEEAQRFSLSTSLITWAGEGTGLFQPDLLVPADGELQAATQLLVDRAALAVAGAVRHEAGHVPVARAVPAYHALMGGGGERRKEEGGGGGGGWVTAVSERGYITRGQLITA